MKEVAWSTGVPNTAPSSTGVIGDDGSWACESGQDGLEQEVGGWGAAQGGASPGQKQGVFSWVFSHPRPSPQCRGPPTRLRPPFRAAVTPGRFLRGSSRVGGGGSRRGGGGVTEGGGAEVASRESQRPPRRVEEMGPRRAPGPAAAQRPPRSRRQRAGNRG